MRTVLVWVLAFLVPLSSVSAAGTRSAVVARESLDERERGWYEALQRTYIHGVDDELAREVLGADALPLLRRLLADPTFTRRDNVVAFIAHLDGGRSLEAILAFLGSPPAGWSTPEEDRALLLAPTALGHMARRGDRESLDALLAMIRSDDDGPLARAAAAGPTPEALHADLLESALRGLALSGAAEARARLVGIERGRIQVGRDGRDFSRSAGQSLDLFDELHGPPSRAGERHPELDSPADAGEPGAVPESFDTQTRAHDTAITYVNHVDHDDPMSDARLDAVLADADLKLGRADYAGDVACCVTLGRSGPGGSFGSPGDGLDIIDTGSEINAVLNNNAARVHVVRAINYCSGPGSNIVGCGQTPGDGIAVVRMSSVSNEAILWAHEYGHNTGLGHSATFREIMYGSINGINNGVTQAQCDRYHSPHAWANAFLVDTGACTDDDGDEVQDGIDVCPGAADPDQADGDADGAGDACDNCPGLPNPAQSDPDADAVGALCDNCPAVANANQLDTDGDGDGDACDICPLEIGGDQGDDDGDGDVNCVDNCRDVFNPAQDDGDGDGVGDACDFYPDDGDNDGVLPGADNCPSTFNPRQLDSDGDGAGELCDNCPGQSNAAQADADVDGAGDACDCQPDDPTDLGPGEVVTVEAASPGGGGIVLSWPAAPGADAYSIARGPLAALAPGQYGACLEEGRESTTFEDPEMPAPGGGLFYLVVAQSYDCGLGTLGFTSDEAGRQNLDPGACLGWPHTDARAMEESSVAGTVSGSLADAAASDDLVEAITEEESNGNPDQRYSWLEHHWIIDIPAGSRIELHVEGFTTSSGDGDAFAFEYTTDGQAWIPVALAALPPADDDIDLAAALPSGLAGPVTFRVVDTDRTPGNLGLDTVSVDEVFVRSVP